MLDPTLYVAQGFGFFGSSSDLEGDLLAISEDNELFLFERQAPGTPFVLTETRPADFYSRIKIEGGVVACGSWIRGRVDVFRRANCLGGTWTKSHELTSYERPRGGFGAGDFGVSLDMHGDLLVVGAPRIAVFGGPNQNRRAGAVSLFPIPSDLDGNGVEDVCQIQSFEDDVDGDGLLDIVESPGSRYCSPNVPTSLGAPATLLLQGSEFVAENRLVVTMLGVPQGSYGLMIAGRLPGFVPAAGINDGNLCIAGGVARRPGFTHSAWFASTDNVIHQVFDTSFSPWGPGIPLTPGETWFFQGWFRDGGTSNMTDAMRIFFE